MYITTLSDIWGCGDEEAGDVVEAWCDEDGASCDGDGYGEVEGGGGGDKAHVKLRRRPVDKWATEHRPARRRRQGRRKRWRETYMH